jgi:fluoride exporter
MINMLRNCIFVGVGGFAGSVVRYLFSIALQQYSLVVPMGTLTANLVGCFLIGIFSQLTIPAGLLSPESRLVLSVGFCGGLTTASSMIYETSQLLGDKEYFHAGGYVIGTIFGSMVTFYLGVILVKIILKSMGGSWN